MFCEFISSFCKLNFWCTIKKIRQTKYQIYQWNWWQFLYFFFWELVFICYDVVMYFFLLQVTVGDVKLSVDDRWNPTSDEITPVVDGQNYSLQVRIISAYSKIQLKTIQGFICLLFWLTVFLRGDALWSWWDQTQTECSSQANKPGVKCIPSRLYSINIHLQFKLAGRKSQNQFWSCI